MKNKKPFHDEFLSKRVFFPEDKLRKEFFNKLKNLFGSWKEIRIHFNIYKSRLEKFRDGSTSIPKVQFLNFLSYFGKKEKELFLNQIILKDKNWGRMKGGITTYKKYSYIFEIGRRIGAKKNKTKYHFPFDVPLTSNLSELMGAFMGDGFTNRYKRNYMIQYTGHATLDNEYLSKRITSIIKEISPNSNPIFTKKDNTVRLTIYSKEFFNLLTKRFGFVPGKKAYTVIMPSEIINSKNDEIINSCIKGIFDTDGGIFFDKRKEYKKPYMRISLQMESKKLIKQIHSLLLKRKINSKITSDSRRIQINGLINCKKFIKTIGFSNKRHTSKIKNI
ncbi:hypothetical protein HQ529_06655 [Candidatus Woesearchaeota archaeon]|nr:hypothetical protein [Candidatus Woesearchaeota archaeon]